MYVKFLLSLGHETDMHWAPVHSFCNPCQLNISHIVKFQTFDRDQRFILAKANISEDAIEVEAKNQARDGLNSRAEAKKHLSQLSGGLLRELCDFYKYDFLIFGYDYPGCEFD